MVKIGILTIHHVINEGAVLQAFSSQMLLKRHFPDCQVEVVNFMYKDVERKYLNNTILLSKNPKDIITRVRRYRNIKTFISNNIVQSKDRLISNDYDRAVDFINLQNYDVLVVGSDEVWKKEDPRPFPNIYWLSDRICTKKIAFAASANKLNIDMLSINEKGWIRNRLNEFMLIGLRDGHSIRVVSELCPHIKPKLRKVSDPTFSLEISEPKIARYEKLGVNFKKRIAGITLCDRLINRKIINKLKELEYQVVGITNYNRLADVNLAGYVSPMEWAETFKIFNLCITDLFHGTIFSIKAGIPFISIDAYSGRGYETKLEYLLKDLDLTESYITRQCIIERPEELYNKIENIQNCVDKKKMDQCVNKMKLSMKLFLDEIKDTLGRFR